MTVTEIWIGVPATERAQQEKLDQGYELQPHTSGGRHGRYVMAHKPVAKVWTPHRIDHLCRLWKAGASRAELLAEFPESSWRTLCARVHERGCYRPAWFKTLRTVEGIQRRKFA